jgi:hypothetical protein
VDPITWLPRKSKIDFSTPMGRVFGDQNMSSAMRSPYPNFEYLIDSFFMAMSTPYSPEICNDLGVLTLKWTDRERVYRKGRPATLNNPCLELTEISGNLEKIYIKQHVLVFAEDYDAREFPSPDPKPSSTKKRPALEETEKFFRRNYRVILPEYENLAKDLLTITNIDHILADIIYTEILTTGLSINTVPDKFIKSVWKTAIASEGKMSLDKKVKSIRQHLGGLTAKEIDFYVDLVGNSALGVKKTRSMAKKLARASRDYPMPPVVRVPLSEAIEKARRRSAPKVSILTGIENPYYFYGYQ